MTWWKLLFEIKTPTWQKFGCVAFVESDGEDRARAEALEVARAEYPGAAILETSFRESTAEAAAAFAEKRRRLEEWLENTRAGVPNRRQGAI